MVNFKEISELLVKKGKVRGKPVAITLFRDAVHPAYEPIQDTPCAIIRYAMDEGKKSILMRSTMTAWWACTMPALYRGRRKL
jgi:uncharacterized protein (DUF169 family)